MSGYNRYHIQDNNETLNKLDYFGNIKLEGVQSDKTNIFEKYLNLLFENVTEINGEEYLLMNQYTMDFYGNEISQIERNKEMMELYSWWLIIESMIMSTTTHMKSYWKSIAGPDWDSPK